MVHLFLHSTPIRQNLILPPLGQLVDRAQLVVMLHVGGEALGAPGVPWTHDLPVAGERTGQMLPMVLWVAPTANRLEAIYDVPVALVLPTLQAPTVSPEPPRDYGQARITALAVHLLLRALELRPAA
jgi:hypothetical protein